MLVFKTSAFNRSATSPNVTIGIVYTSKIKKIQQFNNFLECKKILEYKLKMKKISIFFIIIFTIGVQNLYASEDFAIWLKEFKKIAVKKGISQNTVNEVMNNAKFLPKVIEYDRYQPESVSYTHLTLPTKRIV